MGGRGGTGGTRGGELSQRYTHTLVGDILSQHPHYSRGGGGGGGGGSIRIQRYYRGIVGDILTQHSCETLCGSVLVFFSGA